MEPISIALALGQFVPQIIKWVTGSDKASEVAQQVVDVATSITGKGPDQVVDALKANPDLLLQFKTQIAERETKLIELAYGDTASARQMQETALKQDDVFSKRFVYWFSICWSIFAAVYITGITFINLPEANQRYADTILGFLLGTVISTMFQFFLGTSVGSRIKDYTMAKLIGH
jgi:hypothetical protein